MRSSIREMNMIQIAAASPGQHSAPVVRDGTINAASTNSFAGDLRHYGSGGEAAAEAAALDAALRQALEETPRSPTAARLARRQVESGYLPKSAPRYAAEAQSKSEQRATSPSSLSARESPTRSHGSHESPPTDVAFGSGRPQRPEAALHTASNFVPVVGRRGEVPGIF
jgi:hypothetical protein